MRGLLTLKEDDRYWFDEAAAERPCRFIETYCQHYEGRFAGENFLLAPVQRHMIREVYGWKHKTKNAQGIYPRRFTDWYLEAAVGTGKSPLLAGLGLYGLMADGERGAQVYSLASTYSQARIVFETGKKFVTINPELLRRLRCLQYEIRHPGSSSFWRIVSGKGPGAGCKPSTILGDEVFEWPGPGAYQALRDRMSKRTQPLLITATNAGESRGSFCWQLRQRAIKALKGEGEESLYPAIFAAEIFDEDPERQPDDRKAWHEANPLIGVTMSEEKIAEQCATAMKDPDEDAIPRFCRLYLGIWPKRRGGKWLDLAEWDQATRKPFNASEMKGFPLYIGMDLSQSDDLCALVYDWVGVDRHHIAAHCWTPRETALRYQQRDGIPYEQWAQEGAITLLESRTISTSVRKMLAGQIIALKKAGHQIRAVCYDKYKADDTVAELENAGITCVPIQQGYSVSPGCNELERRLKEATIEFGANSVMRWCAENVEVKADDRGNFWPVKPHAKGRYAGTRQFKIDVISALVTALTESRKCPYAVKTWKGSISALKA